MVKILRLPQLIKNAMTFAQHYPHTLPKPTVGITDDQTEVCLEWHHEDKHAIISITEENHYEYTTYDPKTTNYIPGAEHQPKIDQTLPKDLYNYLKTMQPQTTHNQHWLHKD